MADLFDIIVARKLSGGGGGGSSDFSTAILTVTRGEDIDGKMYIPNLEASPIGTSLFPFLPSAVGTNTYEIVVYSGGTVLIYDGTCTVTVDGDIQAMGGGTYLITGDCTITMRP